MCLVTLAIFFFSSISFLGWHEEYTLPEGFTIPKLAPLIMQRSGKLLPDLGESERAWKLSAARADHVPK